MTLSEWLISIANEKLETGNVSEANAYRIRADEAARLERLWAEIKRQDAESERRSGPGKVLYYNGGEIRAAMRDGGRDDE